MSTTREKIYDGLKNHRGSIKELAKRCNCTPEWIRRVMVGLFEDNHVLEQAAKLWKELELESVSALKKAEKIANEVEQIIAERA